MDNISNNYEDIPKYIKEIEDLKMEIKILNERQTQMALYITDLVNNINKGFKDINTGFNNLEKSIEYLYGSCGTFSDDDDWFEEDDDDEL